MEMDDTQYWINVALDCAIRYREDKMYYMENSNTIGECTTARYKKLNHEVCKLKKAQQDFNKNYKKSFVANIPKKVSGSEWANRLNNAELRGD